MMAGSVAQPVAPATVAHARVTAIASVEIISAEPISVREPTREDACRIDRHYQKRRNVPIVDFF